MLFETIGGLVPAILISRLFLYLLKKWNGGFVKAVVVNAISYGIGVLVAQFGMGGLEHAAIVYFWPQVCCLAFDLGSARKGRLPSN